MSKPESLWQQLISGAQSETMLQAAMDHAALNLSDMVGQSITIDVPGVTTVSINDMITYVGSPEAEIVGIYLLIDGELQGQALLMFSLHDAFYLIDLLMGRDVGETVELDDLSQSALAEVGNLMLAGFLNTLANISGKPLRPSPPAVVVDMLGAILNFIAASVGATSDELVFVETIFKDTDRILEGRFWILPDPSVFESSASNLFT
ncbi:MAG: hypothetical protein B6242_04625 [Anaerolineaceae bacterium 4572_78]|nr:MAG: hypothetical protein B6242_04625 [Anaerolineaceae bacterium 4572_78]